jgi:Uma2 family endonuclease
MTGLLPSPRLPDYIRQIDSALAEEQRLRQQFHDSLREGDRVEFINGSVVKCAPHTLQHHDASFSLGMLMRAYVDAHTLGLVGHENLMVSLARNDFEPDICYWAKARAAAFQPGQIRFPAPDFAAEVLSDDSAALDRGVKLEDYAFNGVAEYWIVDPAAGSIEQYLLDDGVYRLAVRTDDGAIASRAVPGFVIWTRAIFDAAERQRALRAMLA